MELAFAGLQQLCSPILDGLDRLPEPQRDALRIAFGLSGGAPPDRFIVSLAVLTLLSDVADEQPVVCLVDDAQWLDRMSLQALAFVARRLAAEPIALVFAVRESSDEGELAALPELTVEGLDPDAAGALLSEVVGAPLDDQVRDRILAETRGNPLALLELPRGLTPAELAGGFALPESVPLTSWIEESFRRQRDLLPKPARQMLLLAAAEPVGDTALLWRAASVLGLDRDAAASAESAGLMTVGTRVQFRHPLVRSVAYRHATPADRRAVHRALGEATDARLDPDRRAWHRAHAAAAPDEDVAAELERSADRAQRRGGIAAAAAFLERAAALTPSPKLRATRALAAAQAKAAAGAHEAAHALVSVAEHGPLDELERARLGLLRARIEFSRRRGNDAPPLLLDAAERLAPLDAALSRETYLEALGAAMLCGRLGPGRGIVDAAEAARAAPPPPVPPRAVDLLLNGLVIRFSEGHAASVVPLRMALEAFTREEFETADAGPWLMLACRVAPDIWDDELWHTLATRGIALMRKTGALALLPVALAYRAGIHTHVGELRDAEALVEEADRISEAIGTVPFVYTSLVLAGWRGHANETLELIRSTVEDAAIRGEGRAITLAEYVTAVLYTGLGQYDRALEAAERACDHDELGLLNWSLSEMVEAAVRSGRPETGAAALARLEERAVASGTNWALGTAARSRALLAAGNEAEALYRESIDRLGQTRLTMHVARARLVYGEWLRRQGRRVDAREQLRAAHDIFSSAGAAGFAERSHRELAATGETVRERRPETSDDLTAQEAQIARLARDGCTNLEIGAQLFISPRTVEWHLHKVFSKLNIASRHQIHDVLGD
jgi:DNA-binding CsgD family transcriptional regulator